MPAQVARALVDTMPWPLSLSRIQMYLDNFFTGHGRISWDPSVQRRMLLQHFT